MSFENDLIERRPEVTIVMSVYNAEKYLEQQLQSLTIQTYQSWRLLVRNNGSNDQTLSILEQFQNQHSKERVHIVNTTKNINKVYKSFAMLVDQVNTHYIMLCDGDDFWLPEKIKDAVNAISNMEDIHSSEVPLLYHTDLTLVDHNLSPTSISMWRAQRLNPKRKRAIKCLIHNHAIGNTFIFNQALKEKAKLRPESLIMHDVFYLIIASLYGVVSSSERSHMLYRQHGNNICGGVQFYRLNNLQNKFHPAYIQLAIEQKCELAGQILTLHGSKMKSSDVEAFKDIASIPTSSWLMKRIYVLKHRAFMNGFLRNIALLLFL